jgi:hypothetical protein
MVEPAHRRGAATRTPVPALLKGLIHSPNPTSPSHTCRRGRGYSYIARRLRTAMAAVWPRVCRTRTSRASRRQAIG